MCWAIGILRHDPRDFQDSAWPFPSRKMSTPKRGRGQPRKEPTTQIRIYSADKPKLKGKTQAEAVRKLLDTSKWTEAMERYEAIKKPMSDEIWKKIAEAYKVEMKKEPHA